MNKEKDAMAEARKSPNFERFSREAFVKICIGEYIYRKKKALKITQQELAKRSGTTQKEISLIESGDRGIKISTLDRIYTALGEDFLKIVKDEVAEYNNYLLMMFSDYTVPLTMKPQDVRDLLIKFGNEYEKNN